MIASGQVLYYPYTHFRDPAWFKTAALYYDEITRMIPRNFLPNDDDDVKALDSAGFLRRVDVAESAEAVADDFIGYLEKYLTDKQQQRTLFPELEKSKTYIRIQPGKMVDRVKEALRKLYPDQELPKYGDDIDLGPVVGGVYIAFLAKRVSEEKSIPIVTHDPLFQRLIYGPMPQLASSGSDKKTGDSFALASLVIRSVIPADPRSVPVDSIIKFREKHEASRLQFADALKKIGDEIAPTDDLDSLRKFLKGRQTIVESNVIDLEKTMNDVGIATVQNAVLCSVPSWVVGKWALDLQTPEAVGIAAAVSVGVSLFKGYRDIEKVKRNSPWSYVLSLKQLQPSLIDRWHNDAILRLF
jgi:hypothetical protein